MKVYFYVIDRASMEPKIEFNFESESLRHKIGNTMRTNMFEKWIDRVLENKLKIKGLLHLGTEFEYTRTVDVSRASLTTPTRRTRARSSTPSCPSSTSKR